MDSSSNDVISAHKFPSLIDRLMVIGLAPSHPIVVQKKAVREVKFQSEHRDFSKNVVRGAKKRGGARLRPDGTLATITCEDESEFIVRSCIDASLLEVNAQLKAKPDLLHQMPATQGFLALCQPLPNIKNTTEALMSLDDYRKLRFPEEAQVEKVSSS